MAHEIQTLAKEMLTYLEPHMRTNGDTFISQKEGAPDWVNIVCQQAHAHMLPDDHRYRMIRECLDLIAESEDLDDMDPDGLVDIYTADLLAWVSSRNDRGDYVDRFYGDIGGKRKDFVTDLMHGQYMEYSEILGQLRDALGDVEKEDK